MENVRSMASSFHLPFSVQGLLEEESGSSESLRTRRERRDRIMRDVTQFVSKRALGVDASGIRKVFDLAAKMKDPINLSIGLPNFDVPDEVKLAAIDAIQAGHNRYTQTQGIAPLRERLRKDLSKEIGRDVGHVLITSGVSGGLLLAILATIDPADEPIFLAPYFFIYNHLPTRSRAPSHTIST